MKAIGRASLSHVMLVAAGALTASCSERMIPPGTPAPRPSAPAAAAPPPQRQVPDWRDAPITPGQWSWSEEGGHSVARFAGGALELRCDRASQVVALRRAGAAGAASRALTIATSSLTRTVDAAAATGADGGVEAVIPARDGVLDAMAFSRGRFAVEAAGLPTLYVPSWPEVSRVVEDCRR